jgi:hypothetical protein
MSRRLGPDGRTIVAKALAAFRDAIIVELGGNLTATQWQQLELATQLKLRLLQWDAEGDGDPPRQYLTWTNSLSRLLTQLAPKPAPGPQRPGPKPRIGAPPTTSRSLSAIVGNGNGHGRSHL